MGSDAEGEDSSLFPKSVESFRARIDRRIAVGGCQKDEYCVGRLHFLDPDESILVDEAVRILDGGVVSQYLLYHRAKKVRFGDDQVAYLRAPSQSEERIADQARCRLISLREEADPIRDNGVYVFASDAYRFPRKGVQ